MSEEEKEAIEQLRSWRKYIIEHRESVNKANDIEFYLRTALNLIENQQKELNNLKEIEKSHKEENGKLRVEFEKVYEDNLTLAQELEQEKEKNKLLIQGKFREVADKNSYIKDMYISKGKIKAIQGELCKQLGSYVRDEASSEQERIAGGINIINKILKGE